MELLRQFVLLIVCFGAGALYGWSALAAPLQAAFGVTTAQVGLVFSVALLSFTAAVLLVPTMARRISQTSTLSIAALLAGVFITAAAFAPSFWLFAALFGVGFGATSGSLYSTALGIAAASTAPRLTTPMTVSAFGLGGFVFGPLWKALVAAQWGLSALLPLSIVMIIGGGLVMIVGVPTRAVDHTALNRKPTDPSKGHGAPMSSGLLVLIWLIFAASAFAGLMVLGLAAKIMDASRATVVLTSTVLAGVALANTSGRLSAAWLGSGRYSTVRGLLISCSLTALGLLTAALHVSPLLLGAGLVLIAGGYGLTASAIPLLTAQKSTPEDFQRQFGIIFTAWGAAGFIAPWLAGRLFDLSGSFLPAFAIAAVTTVLSAGFILWFRRKLS